MLSPKMQVMSYNSNPKFGIVDIDEFNSFTVADIPGIIEVLVLEGV